MLGAAGGIRALLLILLVLLVAGNGELYEFDEIEWEKRLQYHDVLYRRKLQEVTIPPTNDFRKHHNTTHRKPWEIIGEVNG